MSQQQEMQRPGAATADGARPGRDLVGVEVAGPERALELIDELRRYHAEVAPSGHGGCEVQVELGRDAEQGVLDILAAIDRWIEKRPGERARLRIGARAYSWPAR